MTLEGKFSDDDSKYAMIDSWTTGENFASDLLHAKGLDHSSGWTVELNDEGDIYELNGSDYVLDLISEMEIVPSFPVCKSYFLISPDHGNKDRKSGIINPVHNPEKINKVDFESSLDESLLVPRYYKAKPSRMSSKPPFDSIDSRGNHLRARSLSREYIAQESGFKFPESNLIPEKTKNATGLNHRHSYSLMALDTQNNLSLSKNSRLNRRYLTRFDKNNPDNLKLSETSKLNKRYVATKLDKANEMKPLKGISPMRMYHSGASLSKRSMSLQELGLASSALNDRYFSSRQLLHKTSSLTGGSEALEPVISRAASNNSLHDSLGHDLNQAKHLFSKNLAKESGKSQSKGKQIIRPSSNSSASSISSNLSNDYHGNISGDTDTGDLNMRRPSADLSSRYVKYSAKSQMVPRYPPYNHSTKAYIDRNSGREGDYSCGVRSSAMSDTSEAPSLASHVKKIKIPAHNADLDQYLDDLFNPVLDGNLDELSDARSLAASIKGGLDYCINTDVDWGISDDSLVTISPYDESMVSKSKQKYSTPFRQFQESQSLNDINIDISELKILGDAEKLIKSLKGGGREEKSSDNANLLYYSPASSQQSQDQPSSTNMPFTNIAGMTVPMVDTSQIIHQQLVHQQMLQRAYLASAVQQNLQIQQQLLQQNQAFQQLLQSASSPIGESSSSTNQNSSPSLNSYQPILQMQGLNFLQTVPLELNSLTELNSNSQPSLSSEREAKFNNNTFSSLNDTSKINSTGFRMSNTSPNIPPPPPPPPLSPTAAYKDVYGREKTIRIGKWRWPPPLDESEGGNSSSFLEFKMKKQQEKQDKISDFDESMSSAVQEEEIQRASIVLQEAAKNQKHKKSDKNDCQYNNGLSDRGKESVGKIRISSEMKAKLEQLTIDQTVRSKKDGRQGLIRSMEDIRDNGVKKLSEHRKALLEKQLMGSMILLSDLNQDSKKSRVDKKESGYTNGQFSKRDNHAENMSKVGVTKRNGSRQSRERLDELGPHNRVNTTISTIHAECDDDNLSRSFGGTYLDQISTIGSMAYEESLVSSTSNMKTHRSENDFSRKIKRMSVPPPPPSMDSHENEINPGYQSLNHQGRPSSGAGSSSYYGLNTPIVIRRKDQPPLPMNYKNLNRLSLERLEFVESSDFLKPLDTAPSLLANRKDQNGIDLIKTKKLYPPVHSYALTYSKVPWELKVRKEVFSPSEKIESPMMLNLIFCQIVRDAYSSNCIRLNREERQKLRLQLNNYNIKLDNMISSDHKLPVQRNIIEFAKELSAYFCRLFAVSGGRNLPTVELLGVSHSGVRLFKREKEADCESLRVLDTLG